MRRVSDSRRLLGVLFQGEAVIAGVFNVRLDWCPSIGPVSTSKFGELCKLQNAFLPN